MRTNTNCRVNADDQIVAQLESNGRVIACVSNNNFTSMDEIIGFVYALAGRFMGLARLTIRNKTQGWSEVLSLATRRQAAPAYLASTPHLHGRQYVIPFTN